tara:strand:+ start:3028 stop:3360 length:333 start_codon:yes stop_codon:yes gene_type:complete
VIEIMTRLHSPVSELTYFHNSQVFMAQCNVPFQMKAVTYWRVIKSHRRWLKSQSLEYTCNQESIDEVTRDSIIKAHSEQFESTVERSAGVSEATEGFDPSGRPDNPHIGT